LLLEPSLCDSIAPAAAHIKRRIGYISGECISALAVTGLIN
jgi:hypothetical protein